MPRPFHLGLRDDGHLVSLIRTAEDGHAELGVALPQEDRRREAIPAQWGVTEQAPRPQESATINLPLSQRTQTILSYRLPPGTRSRVNGGLSPMVHSRQQMLPGIEQRIHIGHDHVGLDSADTLFADFTAANKF